MKRILSASMILIGSFLEVYYYQFRFTADGVNIWLGVVIGFGLNLLLLLLVYWNKNTILIIALILYSVISTSAGQTFSMIEKQKSEISEMVNPEKNRILEDIKTLETERNNINNQINNTVTSLEDRYEWKNTLAAAEGRKTEIESQIKNYNNKIDELTDNIELEEKNVYTFYSALIGGVIPKDILKFLFHTALSIFIALMMPTGIKIFTLSEKNSIINNRMDYKTWLELAWYGEKRGRTKIPNVNVIQEYFNIKGIPFDMKKHNEFYNKAIADKYINQSGNILMDYETIRGKL